MLELYKEGNQVNIPLKIYGVDTYAALPIDAPIHSVAKIGTDENNGNKLTYRMKAESGTWVVIDGIRELFE